MTNLEEQFIMSLVDKLEGIDYWEALINLRILDPELHDKVLGFDKEKK